MPSPVLFDNCNTFKCLGLVSRRKPYRISEMLKSSPSLLTHDRISPVLVLVGVHRRKRRQHH